MQGQKNRRIMLLSYCVVCDSEKSKIIIQLEVSGLSSSLRIKHLNVKFL